jgi:ABC-type multidrug transport system ATPase subunit
MDRKADTDRKGLLATAGDDADESDDIAPEQLLSAKASTYRLPKFNSRRSSSNVDPSEQSHGKSFRRIGSKFAVYEDVSSPDALLAGGVFKMHENLATVVEDALGTPIASVEVRFRDLRITAKLATVTTKSNGSAAGKAQVPTLVTPIHQALSSLCSKQQVVEKEILRGISGVFKPARITLVLGQPGSGKSALMKVLSGRFPMSSAISISGDIKYNNMDRSEVLDRLPRFVSYTDQKDNHHPTLTVLETFRFAHMCSSGAELEPWVVEAIKNCSPEQHDRALRVMTAHHKFAPELRVRNLGLERAKDTIVGNAMLRGVSGGERKRVTTGEMSFGRKRVMLLDEISTGLDAASTFDIVSSLRSVARNFKATVVISLLQPPPEVFDLFDDVLLLNDGHIMFHGPREQALPYFQSMGLVCPPRKDVADFLLDLGTDKQQAYVSSASSSSVPFLSADFANHFRASQVFQETLKHLDSPPNSPLMNCDKTPFAQSFWQDLMTLLGRQALLNSRNIAAIVARFVMVVIMGLLYGSTFWNMNETSAQLMLGLFFSSAIFLSMGQAAQMPVYMSARSIFYKQRGANFFRSSAFVLCASLSQVPLMVGETLIYSAIVYWMGGYVALVDRFFVFVVTLFLCQLWFAAFFFFISCIAPNLTIAQPTMMMFVLFFFLFGGFLMTEAAMPVYFVWVYWIDPLSWAVRALSINQYRAPKFDVCEFAGVDYCARFGKTMGSYNLKLFDLPTDTAWVYYAWIYFAASYITLMFFSYLSLEFKRYEGPENTALVQVEVDAAAENDGDGDENGVGAYMRAPETPPMEGDQQQQQHGDSNTPRAVALDVASAPRAVIPVVLAFHDLWYSVPLPGSDNHEEIDLLKGVSGFALPGTMTALMGSSGAGKTTLMDVIAGRKTGGRIRGKILLNGHPATDLAVRRCTGYCEQMDIHSDSATVREALTFSAFLRQDARISDADKRASVRECIELLELEPIADKIIRGSSTEQMKRITIGVELAAQPSVLFMDEPTSGLDARSAKLIMNGVRKIANTGRTVICTIHQPSTEVFNLFDSLLLLRRGGRMVFFGELGADSRKLIDYFESVPGVSPIKPGYNPATWMLECIGAGVENAAAVEQADFADVFDASSQRVVMEEDLDQDGVLRPSPDLPELKFGRKRASRNLVQFRLLSARFFRLYWRTPTYNLTRLMVNVLLGAIFAAIYQGTDYSTYAGANAAVGLIFISTVFSGIIGFNSVMPVAVAERTSFYRERAAQTYNALWYFVAGTLAEIPYVLLSSLLLSAVMLPSVGLLTRAPVLAFVSYTLVLALNGLQFVYLGQLLVYATPNDAVAATLGALLSSIFILFAGFNPPAGSIPTGYQWIHYASPPTYSIATMAALMLANCPDDYQSGDGGNTPLGCMQLSDVPPSIGDNVTVQQYVEGTFDMRSSDVARNLLVLGVLIVAFRLLALVSLRYINHLKR